jgi:hypothetical protein
MIAYSTIAAGIDEQDDRREKRPSLKASITSRI